MTDNNYAGRSFVNSLRFKLIEIPHMREDGAEKYS